MKIQVITTCTGRKAFNPSELLTLSDFRRAGEHLDQRRRQLDAFTLPAGEMYTGEQHVRLMLGICSARRAGHEVSVWIVSAGYGVVHETHEIAPYEATFNTMSKAEREEWAIRLGIAPDVSAIVATPADLTLLLLSDRYLDAAKVDALPRCGGPTWAICASSAAGRFPAPIRTIPLKRSDTSRYRVGMIGLKGEVAAVVLKSECPIAALEAMSKENRPDG
jgi:hypothetical protein